MSSGRYNSEQIFDFDDTRVSPRRSPRKLPNRERYSPRSPLRNLTFRDDEFTTPSDTTFRNGNSTPRTPRKSPSRMYRSPRRSLTRSDVARRLDFSDDLENDLENDLFREPKPVRNNRRSPTKIVKSKLNSTCRASKIKKYFDDSD